jgi:hypothetical protein
MAKEWTFKCFKSSSGTNKIRKWLNALPEDDQAKIDATIKQLEIEKKLEDPPVKKLTGYKYLFEIKIKSGGVQYRPIGYYGPNRKEFTILIGVIKKERKLKPTNAYATACDRIKLIDKDKEGHTIGYWTT